MRKAAIPCQPIGGDHSWLGPDLAKREDAWIYRLSEAQRREILEAYRIYEASAKDYLDATQADFPLPTVARALRTLMRQVEEGCGFLVLRGLPLENLTEQQVRGLYWGLCLHLGVVVPQSGEGEMIGDVRSKGDKIEVTGRSYRSADASGIHTDSADIAMLLCRRKAKAGGRSLVLSAAAIHDRIAETRPDILPGLYEPLPIKLARVAGEQPWYTCPLYGVRDGWFSSRFQSSRYPVDFEIKGAPEMTPLQKEGIVLAKQYCLEPEFQLEMQMEPGDIQILNNHLVYHGRTAFEDHPEFDRKRHLMRLWMAPVTSRPLPPGWAHAYRSVEPATVRGGQGAWLFPERFGAYYKRAAADLEMGL